MGPAVVYQTYEVIAYCASTDSHHLARSVNDISRYPRNPFFPDDPPSMVVRVCQSIGRRESRCSHRFRHPKGERIRAMRNFHGSAGGEHLHETTLHVCPPEKKSVSFDCRRCTVMIIIIPINSRLRVYTIRCWTRYPWSARDFICGGTSLIAARISLYT